MSGQPLVPTNSIMRRPAWLKRDRGRHLPGTLPTTLPVIGIDTSIRFSFSIHSKAKDLHALWVTSRTHHHAAASLVEVPVDKVKEPVTKRWPNKTNWKQHAADNRFKRLQRTTASKHIPTSTVIRVRNKAQLGFQAMLGWSTWRYGTDCIPSPMKSTSSPQRNLCCCIGANHSQDWVDDHTSQSLSLWRFSSSFQIISANSNKAMASHSATTCAQASAPILCRISVTSQEAGNRWIPTTRTVKKRETAESQHEADNR